MRLVLDKVAYQGKFDFMVCIITFDCFMTCCASAVIAMQANLQASAEVAAAAVVSQFTND